MYGKKYYFERYWREIVEDIKNRFAEYRGSGKCPFCRASYRRRYSLVQHILDKHRYDVEELFRNWIPIHIRRSKCVKHYA